MAGIPAIVTDHNYNDEVIINRKQGLVVSKKDICHAFEEAIAEIFYNGELYEVLADGAWKLRRRYDIEQYKNILLSALT